MSPRFQVELRVAGRLVESTSCGRALTIGEGGGLVVSGLGGEVPLVQDGRVVECAGLRGETDGVRGAWVVAAHPEITITIEPLLAVVIERGRWTTIPTRETVVAGMLACCLAGLLGRTAIAGSLTEPEREIVPEETAIALAIYAAPSPERVFVPPTISFAPIEVVPEVVPPPPVPPPAPPLPEPVTSADIGDGLDAMVVPSTVAESRKRRRGRSRDRMARVFESSSSSSSSSLSLSSSSSAMGAGIADMQLEPLHELRADEGGVEEGGLGGVAGGVVGGTGTQADVAIDVPQALPTKIEAPTTDPFSGGFTLDDAFAGHPALAKDQPGTLVAVLHTTKGTIRCELFEDRAPRTVANFVGLALGTRPSLDPATGTWRSRKLYQRTMFHRIVQGFVIQGGDPLGTGSGGPGYTIADEIDPDLRHDAAGVLSMANRGHDTGGSQFFVTLDKAPHIDGTSTVFGRCDVDVVRQIGEVAVDQRSRPVEPVTLRRVELVRETRHEPRSQTPSEPPSGPPSEPPSEPPSRTPSEPPRE